MKQRTFPSGVVVKLKFLFIHSDVNHEMDVGLHGWESTRYSRSCAKVHCHERALYFNSTLFVVRLI